MANIAHLSVVGTDVEFKEPVKRIYDGADVQFFLQSRAYRDLTTFILQMNRAVVPRKHEDNTQIDEYRVKPASESILPDSVNAVCTLFAQLQALTDDAPPDTGPRRFGNVSFRKWYKLVNENITNLLKDLLPKDLHAALPEVSAYLMGSFGSAQRLDYGTGHELSFIVFLAALWKVGYFEDETSPCTTEATPDIEDRKTTMLRYLTLYVFPAYLGLIRKLIVLYNLEPAGSHGVWGLDDNSFLPYMFGSAQLNHPLPHGEKGKETPTPTSGSVPSSPEPSIVTKRNLVEKEASGNLYFGAINFIYQVKRGPFWEHSPILFDISGLKDGWGKINKGLIKMYDAEVLAKFPVVQHFPFGGLFPWERDPDAKSSPAVVPSAGPLRSVDTAQISQRPPQAVGTQAPWATAGSSRGQAAPPGFVDGVTQAPWARPTSSANNVRLPPPTFSATKRFGNQISPLPTGPRSARASDKERKVEEQNSPQTAG